MRFFHCILFAWVIAQISSAAPLVSRVDDGISIELKVKQPDLEAGDGFDAIVEINITGAPRDLELSEIEVFLPSGFRALRPDLGGLKPAADLDSNSSVTGTPSGIRFQLKSNFTFNSSNTRFIRSIGVQKTEGMKGSFARIMSRISGHQIRVSAKLEETAAAGNPFSIWSNEETLNIRPPVISVYLGAIAGALLLALLVGCSAWHDMTQGKSDTFRPIPYYATLFALGSLTSIVIILLATRLDDSGLPLNLQVNDFLGGLIVGLFSAKLSSGLGEKLFPADPGPKPESA